MKLLKQVERRFGRFAIHNLTLYIVGGQGIALLIGLTMPGFASATLLVPREVMAGQWWLLLSFLFTPPFGNPLLALFTLYFLYFMGGALEAHWGAFRYNLYVLIGYLMTIATAFLFPDNAASNSYITGSIFLAFAYLFPNYEIYLFFVLPVRIKWLALITWLYYGYGFLFGDWAERLLIVAAITNFLIFFGSGIYYQVRHGHRQVKAQTRSIVNRDKALHVCAVCGTTDKTHPTMDFRYCSSCELPQAYCSEHLAAHKRTHEVAAPASDAGGA